MSARRAKHQPAWQETDGASVNVLRTMCDTVQNTEYMPLFNGWLYSVLSGEYCSAGVHGLRVGLSLGPRRVCRAELLHIPPHFPCTYTKRAVTDPPRPSEVRGGTKGRRRHSLLQSQSQQALPTQPQPNPCGERLLCCNLETRRAVWERQ